MHKILVSDRLGQDGIDLLNEYDDVEYDLKTDLSHSQLISIIKDYDALIVRSATQADADLIQAAEKLKVIGRAGIGVDNIDITKATEKGIIVMNTPQANTIATAEHTMTMMLAISRHTAPAHQHVISGNWGKSKFTGQQLYRKTLGLIGFGRIARRVAAYAKSFNMHIIAYDPFVSEEIASEHQVKLVNLEELLGSADYISLHTVATAETEKIINEDTLKQTKPGVIVINSARGKLIDEQALALALKSGQVKAAAVDVYRNEPPQNDHPLIGLENVLSLPHLGASTNEAQRDVARQIVEQVVDALNQVDFKNSINMPFSTGAEFQQIQPYITLAEKIGSLQFYMADEPIEKIEIEINADNASTLVRPVACGVLKGLLDHIHGGNVNYISAPALAQSHGITITQSQSQHQTDFSSLVNVKCQFNDKSTRVISGTLFDGRARIVKISNYHLDIDPSGTILVMLNHDVPGVIGKVGTILADHEINIAEWRLGRTEIDQQAMAFINLDNVPEERVIEQILAIDAVIKAKVIQL